MFAVALESKGYPACRLAGVVAGTRPKSWLFAKYYNSLRHSLAGP